MAESDPQDDEILSGDDEENLYIIEDLLSGSIAAVESGGSSVVSYEYVFRQECRLYVSSFSPFM